ncbi:MAG TPA: acyltransferase [Sedimentisphaerales bacterium]|nr:acyltransferase [Sedimentisphaerales bacterium]
METLPLLYRKVKRKLERILLARHRQRILQRINGGEGLHLEGRIMVVYGENLTLGRNVHIGAGAYINCRGGVSIGDHTILSRHVTIYSYDHNFKTPSCLPFDGDVVLKPVHIGQYVWIGMNVTIAPGTNIGNGAVIGMGSVVSGEIPENAIVVSPKAQIVGYRDAEHASKLAVENRFYQAFWAKNP